MEEITVKEKRFLQRVFKAADIILEDMKNSDAVVVVDFDQNDLFDLAEKLNIEY